MSQLWVGAESASALYKLAHYEEIGIHPLDDGSGYEVVATRRARAEESRVTLAVTSELDEAERVVEFLREKICAADLRKM
jgi:hypothetical protein